VAVVKDGSIVLSNIVSSQERVHRRFNGIIPELAARMHLGSINWMIDEALRRSHTYLPGYANNPTEKKGVGRQRINLIAVTSGPGLVGSLLVGVMTARVLGMLTSTKVCPVNHIEGHLYANMLGGENIAYPLLALIVSGGHTELIHVKKVGRYNVLGRTRDDAVGETYDKVSKVLGLGYPGGPVIDRNAKHGNPGAVKFPRPFMRETRDFSFSGIKTAVANFVNDPVYRKKMVNTGKVKVSTADIASSFQQAIIETLVTKTLRTAKEVNVKTVLVGGGVSANEGLRREMVLQGKREGLKVSFPSKLYCTDNAAMIAAAAYWKHKYAKNTKWDNFTVDPNLTVRSWR